MNRSIAIFFIYRRLWISGLILLGLVLFAVGFRLYWGWHQTQLLEKTIAKLKPDFDRWVLEAEDYVQDETIGVADEQNTQLAVKRVIDKWPRFFDAYWKKNVLVGRSEWYMYRGEGREPNEYVRGVEASRGALFQDPVSDQKAYVSTCLRLLEEMEQALALKTFDCKHITSSQLRYFHYTLSDLAHRHRVLLVQNGQEDRLQASLNLLRIFEIKAKIAPLHGFQSNLGWVMQSAHIGAASASYRRLSKLSNDFWQQPDIRNQIEQKIAELANHEGSDALLYYGLMKQIQKHWTSEMTTTQSEVIEDNLLLPLLLIGPLVTRDQRKHTMEYHACIEFIKQGGAPVNWRARYFPQPESMEATLEMSFTEKIDEALLDYFGLYMTIFNQTRNKMNFAMTFLAIKLYEVDHGVFPDTLSSLVPDYLPRVPVDMLDPKQLPIRYLPEMRLIYSVGEDGVDHGSMADEESDKVDDLYVLDGRY